MYYYWCGELACAFWVASHHPHCIKKQRTENWMGTRWEQEWEFVLKLCDLQKLAKTCKNLQLQELGIFLLLILHKIRTHSCMSCRFLAEYTCTSFYSEILAYSTYYCKMIFCFCRARSCRQSSMILNAVLSTTYLLDGFWILDVVICSFFIQASWRWRRAITSPHNIPSIS